MIRGFWIIEPGGRTIFSKSSEAIKIDDVLIGGFLSSIVAFSGEISRKSIESMEMGGLTWLFTRKFGTLFVCAADKEKELGSLQQQLNTLIHVFIEEFIPFEEWLEFLQSWAGNLAAFSKFDEKFNEIMKIWAEVEATREGARIRNTLEIFQQILNLLMEFPVSKKKKINKESIISKIRKMVKKILKDVPQLSSIDVNKEFKWNLLEVNTIFISMDVLRIYLQKILDSTLDVLRKMVGQKPIDRIIEELVSPYIRKDWNRIRSNGLDGIFVKHDLI